jgi:diguanylate cyclase (GGDEF)-like protein
MDHPQTPLAANDTSAIDPAVVAPEAGAPLRDALLDSRQRWRDFVLLAADLAFETDAQGRLTFIVPEPALGWEVGLLLGQPGTMLLAAAQPGAGFNPFQPHDGKRRGRAWLRRGDGKTICLNFTTAPLFDPAGRLVGTRGLAQDASEAEERENRNAAALRRGEVLDQILWCVRQEVLAPRMMRAALTALIAASGAAGAVVVEMQIDAPGGDGGRGVLHETGADATPVLDTAFAALQSGALDASCVTARDGSSVLVCPCVTRFGARTGLVLWRNAGSRRWQVDELSLVSAVSGIVRMLLEQEAVQHDMAQQARTDPLTGLLNRRAFVEEVGRRIDRLEREQLPGALMYVDLDHFKALNDRLGHEAGDEALCLAAALLRATVRPADLVARLGGDEFALWLDGADELAAAERAEGLRLRVPHALGALRSGQPLDLTMSIGIVSRWPGGEPDLELLMHAADRAMYEVKREGRGFWRVGRRESEP